MTGTPRHIAVIAALLLSALAASVPAAPPARQPTGNLCFNGTFDAGTNGLDGWTYDYQWEGNSHYMANHTHVSVLPSHAGRQNVLFLNGSSETKVDSKPIRFELGKRYRCTLEYTGNTEPHMYFTGYKWEPGVRPNDAPHLGDLRRIYKSEFRNHKVTPAGGGWKRVSFEFPLEKLSDLAMKNLKEVRFFTVYIVVLADVPGQIYVDNVEVQQIP